MSKDLNHKTQTDELLNNHQLQVENESSDSNYFTTLTPPVSNGVIDRLASPATRTPQNILYLQRTIGNQAVTRMLKKISKPSVLRAPEDEGEVEESGSLPNITTPLEEGVEKGPNEGGEKEDNLAKAATGATSFRSTSEASGASFENKPLKLSVGDFGINFSNPQVDITDGTHPDKVTVNNISTTFSNPGTKPIASPFGSESFLPTFSGVTWKTKKTKKKGAEDTVSVNFTLAIDCPWGVDAGGRIDVPSGTDAAVTIAAHSPTKKVYEQMVDDLTPVLVEKSWRAPRSTYWSKAICERHEKYHSTDDERWSNGTGKKILKDYLADKTVSSTSVDAGLNTLLQNAIQALKTANLAFYKGGASSYLSYAGEERAFGDGKTPYKNLVSAIKKQGKKLEKEEAKREKLAAKAAAKTGSAGTATAGATV